MDLRLKNAAPPVDGGQEIAHTGSEVAWNDRLYISSREFQQPL
jgi:hypothetical protein